MKERIDSKGKWLIYSAGIEMLIEPSQEWLNQNQPSPTDKQIRTELRANIQNQLLELDKDLNRGTEDLIDLLVSKNIIQESNLTGKLKERKELKNSLREQLKTLSQD